MKKNLFTSLNVLLLAFVLFPGCRKEALPETAALSNETKSDLQLSSWSHGDECRLTSTTSEFAEYSYTYNNRGLVDQMNVSWLDGYLKMKYDEKGHLEKARYFSGGKLINTIAFFYNGDRVVKETWFDGDSQVKVDEVCYFYNEIGKVWKSKSAIQDYSSIYKYTPDGGTVTEWHLYIGGKLAYAQWYTYLPPHHKQPNAARRGVTYDFITPNGWFDNSRWYSTSEKDVSYDENGENPVVLLDQNPHKTIVGFNSRNYVTSSDFFDKLTSEYVHFRFKYENCDCGNANDNKKGSSTQKTFAADNSKFNPLKFLRLGSATSIKEQMTKLRSQYAR